MVPNGWKLTSLGEVCSGSLQTGPFGSQLHAHEYTDEGVPVLMPKDLINYRANNESAAKIPEHRADDLKKHTLQSGDLLFSRRGDVARFALIESDYPRSLCGTGCLKATPNKAHSPLFLSYFLQKNAVKKWLEQNAVGQTMPNMNTAILAELPLMVASSREEEDKIAKVLSTWDKAISTTEKLIETSKQQKKALMQQLLTGKKRLVKSTSSRSVREGFALSKIGDIPDDWEVELISKHYWYQEGPGVRKHQFTENGVKLFNGTNIQQSRIDLSNTSTYISSEEAYGSYSHFLADSGDLVIACSGISVERFDEKIAFINQTHLPLCMNTSTMRFKVKSETTACLTYMRYFMMSDLFKNQIRRQITGSAQLNFGPSHMAKCFIPLPPLEEQKKIASVLSCADNEVDILEAKLAHFKQEKKALMQQLLTGKRRVKVDEEVAA
ncbi:restriction endonuclease subunit S [Vibrio sp. Vb1554]|uniref:restriction endonuclease subunit S n=1 Tax=Vibrio TaxID=662 RepID=UPI000802FFD8|nr:MULTISPECIES: restriction endonuclease subunit S [Vibrio]ANP64623.1 hypothetical protein BAU10_06355 [Vibrio alginolyticus]MDW3048515.1 restriction endonuclease subunit S [Vibrio sp. Vb1554]